MHSWCRELGPKEHNLCGVLRSNTVGEKSEMRFKMGASGPRSVPADPQAT